MAQVDTDAEPAARPPSPVLNAAASPFVAAPAPSSNDSSEDPEELHAAPGSPQGVIPAAPAAYGANAKAAAARASAAEDADAATRAAAVEEELEEEEEAEEGECASEAGASPPAPWLPPHLRGVPFPRDASPPPPPGFLAAPPHPWGHAHHPAAGFEHLHLHAAHAAAAAAHAYAASCGASPPGSLCGSPPPPHGALLYPHHHLAHHPGAYEAYGASPPGPGFVFVPGPPPGGEAYGASPPGAYAPPRRWGSGGLRSAPGSRGASPPPRGRAPRGASPPPALGADGAAPGRASARIARSPRAGVRVAAEAFAFDAAEAAAGAPGARTTLMLRNIPNRMVQADVLAAFARLGLGGTYDFLYAPVDFRTRCGLGYAFVNAVSGAAAAAIHGALDGRAWGAPSAKVAAVSYARLQGRDALVAHFAAATFPADGEALQPRVFARGGGGAGVAIRAHLEAAAEAAADAGVA
jgi:hypothetical protein